MKSLAALVSGGKDSLYATYQAKKQGYEIKYVVGFISENADSYMFHVPNTHLIGTIAKLMNVEYIEVRTKGQKEEELKDIESALTKISTSQKNLTDRNRSPILSRYAPVDGVVCGAIASNYQRDRVKKICDKLGLELVAPLWERNNTQLLKEMLSDGFEIMITAVAGGDAFGEEWLGRKIDEKTITELEKLNMKYGINVTFEGGEAETLVVNCPLYKKRLDVSLGKKHWDAATQSGFVDVMEMDTKK